MVSSARDKRKAISDVIAPLSFMIFDSVFLETPSVSAISLIVMDRGKKIVFFYYFARICWTSNHSSHCYNALMVIIIIYFICITVNMLEKYSPIAGYFHCIKPLFIFA